MRPIGRRIAMNDDEGCGIGVVYRNFEDREQNLRGRNEPDRGHEERIDPHVHLARFVDLAVAAALLAEGGRVEAELSVLGLHLRRVVLDRECRRVGRRSAKRRGGAGGVSRCRTWWAPYH